MNEQNRVDDQATGIATVDPNEMVEALMAYDARPIAVEEVRTIEVVTHYMARRLSKVEVFLGDLSRPFEVEDNAPIEALEFLSALDSTEPSRVRELFANGVQHDIPRDTMIRLNENAFPYGGELARIDERVSPELQRPMYSVTFADSRPKLAYFTYEFEVV